MKARAVGINTCKFHSARQMVFFYMSSHLDVNVMSICLVRQILAEPELVVCSSLFLLVSEISLSAMWTVSSGTQK